MWRRTAQYPLAVHRGEYAQRTTDDAVVAVREFGSDRRRVRVLIADLHRSLLIPAVSCSIGIDRRRRFRPLPLAIDAANAGDA